MTPYQNNTALSIYFATRLYTNPWDNANDATRTKASNMMTRYMNNLAYIGKKTIESQENQFPRTVCETDLGTPQEILDAHAEGVLAILDGVDVDKEYDQLFIANDTFGSVKTTYDLTTTPEHIVAGIPSIASWRLIQPYLRAAQLIHLRRV